MMWTVHTLLWLAFPMCILVLSPSGEGRGLAAWTSAPFASRISTYSQSLCIGCLQHILHTGQTTITWRINICSLSEDCTSIAGKSTREGLHCNNKSNNHHRCASACNLTLNGPQLPGWTSNVGQPFCDSFLFGGCSFGSRFFGLRITFIRAVMSIAQQSSCCIASLMTA